MLQIISLILVVLITKTASNLVNVAKVPTFPSSDAIETAKVINTTKAIQSEVNYAQALPSLLEKQLKVAVMTWNLAERSPTLSDCAFIRNFTRHDIIVLGVQECEDVRPRRTEGRRSRKWRQLRNAVIPKRIFECLGEHKIGGIQLAIYVSKTANKLIEGVQTIEVACGVGNVLTNKGAICMLLRLRNQKTLAFINAHLAAHQKNVAGRNANYHRIVDTITKKSYKAWLKTSKRSVSKASSRNSKRLQELQRALKSEKSTEKSRSVNELFDATLFFGDLNYRMNLPKIKTELFCKDYAPALVAKSIPNSKELGSDDHTFLPSSAKKRMSFQVSEGQEQEFEKRLSKLLRHDQLRTEIRFGAAFGDFREAPISFPPTFKYDKLATTFDTSKKGRAPAWTDRVLFASEDDTLLQASEYSAYDVRASDHRPVVASLVLKYEEKARTK